jgi:dephospho-CoA kinase
MLRVGLTGGLGSGKSSAAQRFAARGAYVLSSDEIGRELMQPGQPVYSAIVAHFGESVVAPDGSLDRAALSRLAFGTDRDGPARVEELNAIVHPAVLARQAQTIAEIAARDAHAVVIVESALLFETRYGGDDGWHRRFDRIILVRASDDLKVARFVARSTPHATISHRQEEELRAQARRRLTQQIDDARKAAWCDFVLVNDGSAEELNRQVDALWPILQQEATLRQG